MPSIISASLRRPFVAAATFSLRLLSRRANAGFHVSLAQPELAQDRLLARLLKKLARTEYGKHCGLRGDEDYRQFRTRIPIQTYDELEPWLSRQLASKQAIITPDPVVHIEPTSGSSGARKSIPYTRTMLRGFSNMFRIWVHDLICHGPGFKTGRIFISSSPMATDKGFDTDLEYLDQPLRFLLAPFLLVPPRGNKQDFVQDLAVSLLHARDLEVISIWSPSYLLVVLDHIRDQRVELAAALPDPAKTALLAVPVNWQDLWPDLKLVSCWDNALSSGLAAQLRELFPRVLVQGKGLLATEAPITVPLQGVAGSVPLLDDVFLEFESADGDIKRLHELDIGASYQLIISQAAGLMRYRLGDLVEVVGCYRSTPTLIFIGRAGQVCDLVGEKLNEVFVRQSLEALMPEGRFVLVPDGRGYVLLSETVSPALASSAEAALCRAHHYALARRQGQLSPLRVQQLPNLLVELRKLQQKSEIKAGDIKDTALITNRQQATKLLARCADNQIVETVQTTV